MFGRLASETASEDSQFAKTHPAIPGEQRPRLGEDRSQAIRRMIRALESYAVLGVKTPIGFLIDVLSSQAFAEGETYTDFIPTHFADWTPGDGRRDLAAVAAVADAMSPKARAAFNGPAAAAVHPGPFQTLGNWRL